MDEKIKTVSSYIKWYLDQNKFTDLKDKESKELALEALRFLAHNYKKYDESSVVTKTFLEELILFVEKQYKHIQEERRKIMDSHFSVIECLSVVMKESSLLNKKEEEIESRVINYFRTSGHWGEGDTLVEKCFFKELPKKYKG